MPLRHGEPCLTSQSDFPPKPLSITESQYVPVFQIGLSVAERNLKNPPGLVQMRPTPSLLRCPRGALTTALITHTATQASQGCSIHGDLQHRSMWLSGTGANQSGKSGPKDSPDTEAMRHLPRTLWEGRRRSLPLIPFPLVLPAYVWQKGSNHRLSGTDLQSKASG